MLDWLAVFIICAALFYFAFDVIVELLINITAFVLVIAAQFAVLFIWIAILFAAAAVITSPLWLGLGLIALILKFLHWLF